MNRLTVDRRPLLLLVSSTSLLPLLVPARDVRGLPARLAELVAQCLRRRGIEARIVAAEADAMSSVVVAPAQDRSVLGSMVDFAKAVPFHLETGHWDDATLQLVEARLAETPCRATRRFDQVIFPVDAAPTLLRDKWNVG